MYTRGGKTRENAGVGTLLGSGLKRGDSQGGGLCPSSRFRGPDAALAAAAPRCCSPAQPGGSDSSIVVSHSFVIFFNLAASLSMASGGSGARCAESSVSPFAVSPSLAGGERLITLLSSSSGRVWCCFCFVVR